MRFRIRLWSRRLQDVVLRMIIQSAGMALPPIIAGFIISVHRTLPVLVASAIVFLFWLVFASFFKPKTQELFRGV